VQSLLRWLDCWERRLCVTGFSALAALLFADVLLRELLGNGIAWAHQAGVYANLVVVLFGMGLATSGGAQLRPRFADHWLPASWEPALVRIGHMVSAGFLFLFAGLALQLALETRQLAEMATVLRIPLWPVQLLLVAGFASTGLRHACYSLRPELGPVDA
jgi:TRAP-type C4-dicarboxylate transport system permease small subunit